MNNPRTFRIRVEGDLDSSWSERLGGLVIEIDDTRARRTATLTGTLRDQSALSGVLNTLMDLRQLVVSVETLED